MPIKKSKIVILHSGSGDKPEEVDTLKQVDEVASALADRQREIILLSVCENQKTFLQQLQDIKPDRVFNLVETYQGSDGNIYQVTAMLEGLGIRYTGASTRSLLTTGDKRIMKQMLALNHIATPLWYDTYEAMEACGKAKGKFIVKSVTEHGSLGLSEQSVVEGLKSIEAVYKKKKGKYGGEWFIEQYVPGRELHVPIFGSMAHPRVLPVSEIIFRKDGEGATCIYDYASKWREESDAYMDTCLSYAFTEKDTALLQELEKICLQCWGIFSLQGYVRIDFRIDEKNLPWVIDINSNACLIDGDGDFTPAEKAGISQAEMFEKMLSFA